jgi:putative pyruvate formate lyase activating enzyme
MNNGIEISIERFSEICLELQNQGATNINLVTPTHFVPLIIDGLKLAKKMDYIYILYITLVVMNLSVQLKC